jgi:hypothetical protein
MLGETTRIRSYKIKGELALRNDAENQVADFQNVERQTFENESQWDKYIFSLNNSPQGPELCQHKKALIFNSGRQTARRSGRAYIHTCVKKQIEAAASFVLQSTSYFFRTAHPE